MKLPSLVILAKRSFKFTTIPRIPLSMTNKLEPLPSIVSGTSYSFTIFITAIASSTVEGITKQSAGPPI